jgi:hypothetical protein
MDEGLRDALVANLQASVSSLVGVVQGNGGIGGLGTGGGSTCGGTSGEDTRGDAGGDDVPVVTIMETQSTEQQDGKINQGRPREYDSELECWYTNPTSLDVVKMDELLVRLRQATKRPQVIFIA